MALPDFPAINARLIPRLRELLPIWLPLGKFRGDEFIIGSVRGEAGESCSINWKTGIGRDFAAGEGYGDPIALYAAIHGLSMSAAARELDGEHMPPPKANGHDSADAHDVPRETKTPEWSDATLAPADAGNPRKHYMHGYPTATWLYYLAGDGGPAFIVCRYDFANGEKSFSQYTWRENQKRKRWEWAPRSWPSPRPLYKLRELLARPLDTIVVCEGEKAADAAATTLINHVVITWAGGVAGVRHADWESLKGRDIVLWEDADKAGHDAMVWLAGHLITRGAASVAIVDVSGRSEGWDAADATAEERVALVASAKPIAKPTSNVVDIKTKRITRGRPERSPGTTIDSNSGAIAEEGSAYAMWDELKLDRIGGGAPFATAANIQLIASLHKKYQGRIYWDVFRMRKLWVDENGEREWNEEDTLNMLTWVQRVLKLPKMTKTHIRDGVDATAMQNKKNSLIEWLETLEWDGIERLPTLMTDVFRAESNDYTSAVGRCWFVSMIARAYNPGCQVDTMVVLEGGQGAYKSSALNIIGGPYYAALPAAFGNRDFLQALDGMWLIEIPDMSGFKGRDIEHVKAIITTRQDRYCRRYAHDAETFPRQCVFAATANRDDWNEDETGARRFLPVKVGASIDRELLRELREQYFAEAVHRYKQGESWWDIPGELASQQQALRRPEDSWEPAVRAAINAILKNPLTRDKTIVTIPQIFEILQLPLHQQGKSEQMRTARILRDNGWLRKTAWDGERVVKQWFKPVTLIVDNTKESES